jgi:hypothetical protein
MDDAILVGLTVAALFAISVGGYIYVRSTGMQAKSASLAPNRRSRSDQQGRRD